MSPEAVEIDQDHAVTNGYPTSKNDKEDTKKRNIDPAKGGDHALVLATFRCLIADLVQQFNGGHPG